MNALRTFRSKLAFATAREWHRLLGACALVASLLTLVNPTLGIAIGVLALGSSVASFTKDLHDHRIELRRINIVNLDPTSFDKAEPSVESERIISWQQCHFQVDDSLNRLIANREIDIIASIRHKRFRLNAQLTPLRDYMIRRGWKYGKVLFNSSKVRLETDLNTQILRQGSEISCSKADYFSGVGSNDLASHRFEDGVSSQSPVILDGSQLTLHRARTVRSLSESWLANLIGVSTLAITTDSKALFNLQTEGNMVSEGRYASSGSGSLDFRDLQSQRGEKASLREAVIRGMEREMIEECRIDPGEIVETRLSGYARDLSRGGKPEFYGVTILNVGADAVNDRRVRPSERDLVGRIATFQVDLGKLSDDPEGLAGVPSEIVSSASTPLLMTIYCLGTALANGWTLSE